MCIYMYVYKYMYILYILFSYCDLKIELGRFVSISFFPVDLKDGRANTFNRLRFKKVQTLL